MKYRIELYPESLTALLNYGDEIAEVILTQLKSQDCKRIDDLYDIVNGKVIRNKQKFDDLEYTANAPIDALNPNEFKGLYVFGEDSDEGVKPVYVGISRTVFRRLKQHAWGKKHNQCSLAYLKTKKKWLEDGRSIDRTNITDEDMLPAKSIIQNYKVALFHVPNDYDLYFLEVVLAAKFRTKWNSFRTH